MALTAGSVGHHDDIAHPRAKSTGSVASTSDTYTNTRDAAGDTSDADSNPRDADADTCAHAHAYSDASAHGDADGNESGYSDTDARAGHHHPIAASQWRPRVGPGHLQLGMVRGV